MSTFAFECQRTFDRSKIHLRPKYERLILYDDLFDNVIFIYSSSKANGMSRISACVHIDAVNVELRYCVYGKLSGRWTEYYIRSE